MKHRTCKQLNSSSTHTQEANPSLHHLTYIRGSKMSPNEFILSRYSWTTPTAPKYLLLREVNSSDTSGMFRELYLLCRELVVSVMSPGVVGVGGKVSTAGAFCGSSGTSRSINEISWTWTGLGRSSLWGARCLLTLWGAGPGCAFSCWSSSLSWLKLHHRASLWGAKDADLDFVFLSPLRGVQVTLTCTIFYTSKITFTSSVQFTSIVNNRSRGATHELQHIYKTNIPALTKLFASSFLSVKLQMNTQQQVNIPLNHLWLYTHKHNHVTFSSNYREFKFIIHITGPKGHAMIGALL